MKGGSRPIIDEKSRVILLASLSFVDAIVLFSEETPLNLISNLNPDILTKGGDYKAENIVGNEVVTRRNVVIPADADAGTPTLRAVFYQRQGNETSGDSPCAIYFHGGGHTVGNVDAYDGFLSHLADRIPQWSFLSVEYRLGPSHPFPAAGADHCRDKEAGAGDGEGRDVPSGARRPGAPLVVHRCEDAPERGRHHRGRAQGRGEVVQGRRGMAVEDPERGTGLRHLG